MIEPLSTGTQDIGWEESMILTFHMPLSTRQRGRTMLHILCDIDKVLCSEKFQKLGSPKLSQ